MDCSSIREHIHLYIDRRLPGEETLAIDKHILQCRACQEELTALRHTVGLVEGIEPVSLPPHFSSLVMERIYSRSRRIEPLKQSALVWLLATLLGTLGLGLLLVSEDPFSIIYSLGGGSQELLLAMSSGENIGLADLIALANGGLSTIWSIVSNLEGGIFLSLSLMFVACSSLLVYLVNREYLRYATAGHKI